jgi:glycosyltransferase involved in cell wall biosynthesis
MPADPPARHIPRICIFTETFHPVIGGGETQARLLAEQLRERGCDAVVVTRRSSAGFARREHVNGIPVYRLNPTGRGQLKKWGLLFTGFPALLRLRRQYDVIFVSGFRIIGPAALLAACITGKRVVLKADSQGEMSGAFFAAGLERFGMSAGSPAFRTFLRLRNALLRRADAFAAITADVAGELAAAGIPANNVVRIPNAVDTARFTPVDGAAKAAARNRLGLPPHGRIAVYTGRLVSYKGLPNLVLVWAAVRASHPDTTLVLVGAGGLDIHACEDQLRAMVRETGLEGHVVFTGNVTNVHDYLHAADMYVFPTENDAFPSSLVEAMACGLPVITTPVGAIPEIVADGETGLLVPPANADALYQAIDRLLTDDGLARRLGVAAATSAADRFAAAAVAERYLELFSATGPGRSSA